MREKIIPVRVIPAPFLPGTPKVLYAENGWPQAQKRYKDDDEKVGESVLPLDLLQGGWRGLMVKPLKMPASCMAASALLCGAFLAQKQ